MKYHDRKPPENVNPFLMVLHRRNGEDRDQQSFSNPLRQKLKHLKGMVEETHPNPRDPARFGDPREEKDFGGGSGARAWSEAAEIKDNDGGGDFTEIGHRGGSGEV